MSKGDSAKSSSIEHHSLFLEVQEKVLNFWTNSQIEEHYRGKVSIKLVRRQIALVRKKFKENADKHFVDTLDKRVNQLENLVKKLLEENNYKDAQMVLKMLLNIESLKATNNQINSTVVEWKIKFGDELPEIKFTEEDDTDDKII